MASGAHSVPTALPTGSAHRAGLDPTPSDSPSLDTHKSPTRGRWRLRLNPSPASCTRHPSLHFILPMSWDPVPAEALHCRLPAFLGPLTGQHTVGPCKGAPETTAWSSTPRLEWVARHAAPGSRVLVESGLVGGGALPRRACPCTAELGAGLGWSLSYPGLQDPAPHKGADGVRAGKIVSKMEGFKRPIILAFTPPWMWQDPVHYPAPGLSAWLVVGVVLAVGNQSGGVHDWAGLGCPWSFPRCWC